MMKKKLKATHKLALALFTSVLTLPGADGAAGQELSVQADGRRVGAQVRAEVSGIAQPRPYDRRLMSEKEWATHNETMRGIKDLRERDAYRQRVHAEVRKRAARQGIQLPSSPPDWAYCAGSGCLGRCPYPPQLMSEKGWVTQNEKMRGIKDLRQRDAYRHQVHTEMTTRAARQRIKIPASPPDWAFCAGSGCLGQMAAVPQGQAVQQPGQVESSGVKPRPKPDAIPINSP